MRWVIVYADGSEFSNADGPPEEAPGGGVVAIAQEDELVGLAVHQQEDFYAFDRQWGGWYGLDYYGLAQYLARPGVKVIKMGESVRTDVYREVVNRLRSDPRLPAKSAEYPWEPRKSKVG